MASMLFQRALEEMKAQNPADAEQWQMFFEGAKQVLGKFLNMHHA